MLQCAICNVIRNIYSCHKMCVCRGSGNGRDKLLMGTEFEKVCIMREVGEIITFLTFSKVQFKRGAPWNGNPVTKKDFLDRHEKKNVCQLVVVPRLVMLVPGIYPG